MRRKKNNNQSTEKQEEDALVLWDCVSMFDTEEEGSLKQEETSETNVTTRSQSLVKNTSQYFLRLRNFNKI